MKATLVEITVYIYLIPLLFGLLKIQGMNNREKLFLLFIFISASMNILTAQTGRFGNNLYIVYLFVAGEALILPHFLLEKTLWKKSKLIFSGVILILLTVLLFEAFAREGGTTKFNNLSLSLNSLVLGALSIWCLIRLRLNPMIDNLATNSIFWFSLGLALYYFGNVLFFAFSRVFQESNPELLMNIFDFRIFVVYLSIIAYTIGFLKIKSGPRKVAFS